MEVTLTTGQQASLNWSAKGSERIIQNVFTLINTFTYEVAYDRTLGLTGKYIDKPNDKSIALATAEIIELIAIREPRATVKEIDFIGIDEKGQSQFKVVIDIV